MTYAIDISEIKAYVLKADTDLPDGDPAKPVFHIRPLDANESAIIDDTVSSAMDVTDESRRTVVMKANAAVLRTLDFGLVKFENLHARDGKLIPWDSKDKTKMYSHLPQKVRLELAGAIRDLSTVTEEEAKNSDSERA